MPSSSDKSDEVWFATTACVAVDPLVGLTVVLTLEPLLGGVALLADGELVTLVPDEPDFAGAGAGDVDDATPFDVLLVEGADGAAGFGEYTGDVKTGPKKKPDMLLPPVGSPYDARSACSSSTSSDPGADELDGSVAIVWICLRSRSTA